MVIKVLTPMAVSKEYTYVITSIQRKFQRKKNIKRISRIYYNANTLEALKQVEQHLRTIIKLLHTRIKKLTPKTKA
jgi:hypothetical protein